MTTPGHVDNYRQHSTVVHSARVIVDTFLNKTTKQTSLQTNNNTHTQNHFQPKLAMTTVAFSTFFCLGVGTRIIILPSDK